MRLLIDTNIIIDVLLDRPGLADSSLNIWRLCEAEEAEGYLSTLSFANIAYILRKELTPESTESILKTLNTIFMFVDLTGSDLQEAAKLYWEDYEDALQSNAAKRIRADFIVTRNIRDFSESSVPAIMPEDLLFFVTFNDKN